MEIIRIAAMAMIILVVGLIVKKVGPEFSVIISIAGIVLLFAYGVGRLGLVIQLFNNIKNYISVDQKYIECIVKIIGISYIAQIGADICKDAGYNALGTQLIILGKLSILVMSVPIINGLVGLIWNM